MLITELENKPLRIVLEEMCRRVDVDPSTVDVAQENWYWKTTWTLEEQESFADWFDDQLQNKQFARELVQYPTLMRSPKDRRKVINHFLLDYGWKIKED